MADNNGNNSDKLIYFLIGAGIGAVTAMLLRRNQGANFARKLQMPRAKAWITLVTQDEM